jgi:sugar phosphate isomerase/epimerase
MCAGVERLARFSPSVVLCLTGGGEGRSPDEARRLVVDGFREVARTARQHGIGLSIEPVRFAEGSSLFSKLSDTAGLVKEIHEENVGIMFDFWHHWDSPTVQEDIAEFGSLINSVHVADWRNPSRGEFDRALPGDGAIDMASLIRALEKAGYKGWYDLEVFADDSYADSVLRLDERELLRLAWLGFAAAWDKAGLD